MLLSASPVAGYFFVLQRCNRPRPCLSTLDHSSSILVILPLALIAHLDRVIRCAARLIGCIPKYASASAYTYKNKIKKLCATRCIGFQLLSASLIGSFIQTISIGPLQVHFYSEALPTQHGYCAGVSRRSAKGNYELRTFPRSLRGG